MCCIVSHDWRKYAGFAEPTFQLNDKFEDFAVVQLELHTKCVVVVQEPVKLNVTHPVILFIPLFFIHSS